MAVPLPFRGIARELDRTVRRLHTLRVERNLAAIPELALTALHDDLEQIIPAAADRANALRGPGNAFGSAAMPNSATSRRLSCGRP